MKPIHRVAGDHFLIFKYGDGLSLQLNFRTLMLVQTLRERRIKGIRGISSSINSLMLDYDPRLVSVDELIREVDLLGSGEEVEKARLRSRLVHVPVVYGDRWTRACAEAFHSLPNLEFVAEQNGLSVDELVQMHQACVYWVLYIGFTPGLPSFVPINPAKSISVPKYEAPRTRTPRGTLGIGGILQCLYPLDSPGGYYMLGRTPLRICDPARRNPVFKKDIVLFRPGDRLVFEPIGHEEFRAIEKNLETYPYRVEEEDWTLNRFPQEEA